MVERSLTNRIVLASSTPAWLRVSLGIAVAICASGCHVLPDCLLCPSNNPYIGALPAQGPSVHASLGRVELWTGDCNQKGCGRPPSTTNAAGAYELLPNERVYLELEVEYPGAQNQPGVQYRELSVQVSKSWGVPGDIFRVGKVREDQMTIHPDEFSSVFLTPSRLEDDDRIQIRIEESGPDLPTPVVIEPDVLLASRP